MEVWDQGGQPEISTGCCGPEVLIEMVPKRESRNN